MTNDRLDPTLGENRSAKRQRLLGSFETGSNATTQGLSELYSNPSVNSIASPGMNPQEGYGNAYMRLRSLQRDPQLVKIVQAITAHAYKTESDKDFYDRILLSLGTACESAIAYYDAGHSFRLRLFQVAENQNEKLYHDELPCLIFEDLIVALSGASEGRDNHWGKIAGKMQGPLAQYMTLASATTSVKLPVPVPGWPVLFGLSVVKTTEDVIGKRIRPERVLTICGWDTDGSLHPWLEAFCDMFPGAKGV